MARGSARRLYNRISPLSLTTIYPRDGSEPDSTSSSSSDNNNHINNNNDPARRSDIHDENNEGGTHDDSIDIELPQRRPPRIVRNTNTTTTGTCTHSRQRRSAAAASYYARVATVTSNSAATAPNPPHESESESINNNNTSTGNNNIHTSEEEDRHPTNLEEVSLAEPSTHSNINLPPPPPSSSLLLSETTTTTTTPETTSSKDESSFPFFPLTLLDFAQQKFTVPVQEDWTVSQLKHAGVAIHHVPVPLQRLVYAGKLLQDDDVLSEAGIRSQIRPGQPPKNNNNAANHTIIVHLFPKPRVVVMSSSTNTNPNHGSDAPPSSHADNDDAPTTTAVENHNPHPHHGGGARVPTIVLDPNEAIQRSHILVLGSAEYVETQNNVKLFSFMLLVISIIELFNLLALALGVPTQSEPNDNDSSNSDSSGGSSSGNSWYPSTMTASDDIMATFDDASYEYWQNHHNNNNMTHTNTSSSGATFTTDPNYVLYQEWGWPNTVDLLISAGGVYVAMVGMKASNENTRRLARLYFMGTVTVGILWMLFNYYVTVRIDERIVDQEEHEHEPEPQQQENSSSTSSSNSSNTLSREDIYKSAFSVMVLPGMVWILCCLRAAQFHHLLAEAEQEAAERIRAQMAESESLSATDSASTTISEESVQPSPHMLSSLPSIV